MGVLACGRRYCDAWPLRLRCVAQHLQALLPLTVLVQVAFFLGGFGYNELSDSVLKSLNTDRVRNQAK